MGLVKPYTEDETTLIQQLYREGYSASQIAQKLGTGRSRNAIIGFIDRHIHKNKHETERNRSPRPARLRIVTGPRIKPEPFPKRPVPVDAPPPLNVKLEDLKARQCRYACSDPAFGEEHLFCGHTSRIGDAYCDFHHAL
jgi:hypothetical protein